MLPRDYDTNPSQANPDIQLAGVQYERNPGAEYGDHITNTAAICNTSASHTYGNVMAIMEKFILDLFPPDLFKTVTASTTIASRQVNHLPNQLMKKEFPIMILVPRISFGQDDNRFLANTIMNSRITNTHATWGEGSLLPLANDNRKNIWVHGHYNRAVMYLDIVLSFNTYAEQINWMSYIHNFIPIGHNQLVTSPLELYIPEDFCNLIGHVAKIPVRNGEDVSEFLRYMNSIWGYPITYKLKGGSNSDEFFMYHLEDIDVVFQEPQMGPGVKEGQIKRAFDISFTVRCDFNTIGYFTLNSPTLKRPIHIHTDDSNSAIVPIFTDVINLEDFQLPIGWVIYSWPIFKLEIKDGKVTNHISIDSILNESLKVVIHYHLKMGISMDRFINIQFRENGKILNNEMYYVDWVKRELVILKPNARRTYRLIITVSPDYINNLIKELYNLE